MQSLKFHLELIYVLNINVFMFVFKRKLIQQKVEKKTHHISFSVYKTENYYYYHDVGFFFFFQQVNRCVAWSESQ